MLKNTIVQSRRVTYRGLRRKSSSSSPLSTPVTIVSCILVVLTMTWVGTIAFFYTQHRAISSSSSSSSLSSTTLDSRSATVTYSDRKKEPASTSKVKKSYEGWQPAEFEDNDKERCQSWRKCFADKHMCPGRCRDDNADLIDGEGRLTDFDDTDWVPDVEILHRMLLNGHDDQGRPWPPPLVTPTNRELCERIGTFGGKGDENIVLLDAVPIQAQPLVLPPDAYQTALKQSKVDGGSRLPRILCMVYTMKEKHASSIRAMRETWAPGCDGFLAFSTSSDPRIPSINLKHDGPESYENMWQKVRSIWQFVGKHYLNDFDFFFQGGDDLFVLPQNLRLYLSRTVANPDQDDFFGGRRFEMSVRDGDFFNSGGAGYVLSRATLRKFVSPAGIECMATRETSMEDVMIARCLQMKFGISVVDTRDEQERERFHPFSPGSHYTWTPPIPPQKDWYEAYNRHWPPKLGKDCCAPDSVSFHYIKRPAMVRHLHSLLYFCDRDHHR